MTHLKDVTSPFSLQVTCIVSLKSALSLATLDYRLGPLGQAWVMGLFAPWWGTLGWPIATTICGPRPWSRSTVFFHMDPLTNARGPGLYLPSTQISSSYGPTREC